MISRLKKRYIYAILYVSYFQILEERGMQEEEIITRLQSDIARLKTKKGYLSAGFPFFATLFGRDSLIAAWQMLLVYPDIAKATLYWLAYHQATTTYYATDREPGKILHVLEENQSLRTDAEFPYFGSVDSTPLFVIVAGEYYKATKNKAFLLEIWPNIVAAINWLVVCGSANPDHLITYERKTPNGDFHQGWKDCMEDHLKIAPPVAIVEVQGYAYAAYRAATYLAEQLGMHAYSWFKKAEEIREAFHHLFWWEGESYYYMALDGSKNPVSSVSSNPGHLLVAGIIPDGLLEKVVTRIFKPDIFTPYGIRTLSEEDDDFNSQSYHQGSVWPHDNWMIYIGLKRLGLNEEADKIKQALLLAYQELGGMPELFRVEGGQIFPLTEGSEYQPHPGPNSGPGNLLQAWATGALLNMMLWRD